MNLTLGSQQDVSEFNDIFLDILERGFACLFPGNENFIRQAFYGKSIEFTDALESDSSQIEVENKNEFCHLVCFKLAFFFFLFSIFTQPTQTKKRCFRFHIL